MENQHKFTIEELGKFDGKEGRPAYVGYKGKVYDVSEAYLWLDGEHMSQHQAGQDLTAAMEASPHGERVIETMKEIGDLV